MKKDSLSVDLIASFKNTPNLPLIYPYFTRLSEFSSPRIMAPDSSLHFRTGLWDSFAGGSIMRTA
jgi:hypothetical protein